VARTVEAVTNEPGSVLVLFDNQSSMRSKTAGAVGDIAGGKIRSAHEAKAEFKIEFDYPGHWTIFLDTASRRTPQLTFGSS
jgi:hypothetical protein